MIDLPPKKQNHARLKPTHSQRVNYDRSDDGAPPNSEIMIDQKISTKRKHHIFLSSPFSRSILESRYYINEFITWDRGNLTHETVNQNFFLALRAIFHVIPPKKKMRSRIDWGVIARNVCLFEFFSLHTLGKNRISDQKSQRAEPSIRRRSRLIWKISFCSIQIAPNAQGGNRFLFNLSSLPPTNFSVPHHSTALGGEHWKIVWLSYDFAEFIPLFSTVAAAAAAIMLSVLYALARKRDMQAFTDIFAISPWGNWPWLLIIVVEWRSRMASSCCRIAFTHSFQPSEAFRRYKCGDNKRKVVRISFLAKTERKKTAVGFEIRSHSWRILHSPRLFSRARTRVVIFHPRESPL